MKPLALLLGAALLFASAARAEDPAPVTPLSDTLRFLGLVMQDGSISPDEKEEIVEFNAATGPMSFDFGGKAETFLAPDDESKALLGFFVSPVNLNDLWLIDTDRMRLFVRIAEVGTTTRERLTNFAASKFNEVVEYSNISNGYGPIRDKLVDYLNVYKPLEDPDNNMARRIGYDAMVMVDKYHNDQVPDFIYDWLIPYEYLDASNPENDNGDGSAPDAQ